MNPLSLLKLMATEGKIVDLMKGNKPMNVKIPQLITLITTLLGTVGAPVLATNWVTAHPGWYVGFVAAASILHALLPSVFGAPSAQAQSATGIKAGLILFVLLLCGSGAIHAQTTTSTTSTGFSASTDAVGVYYGGAWSVGSHVTESFDLIDWGTNKSSHLFIQGNELLAPTPGLNLYTGGFEYQPNLGNLFSKTNIPANTIQLFVNGSSGVGTAGSGPNHVSFLAGGGIRYNFNSSLTWNSLQATYVRFGNQNFPVISSGLTFIFGPKATTVVSSAAVAKK